MFAFYDLETTGTSPAFDQPLQFAAILTDDDLTPVDSINIRCRLSPHILPAPWALAVTGVMPDMLTDPTLPTLFEFMQTLSDLIARWGPATWTGYNSIAFDEEMLRQALYQNLHPSPYITQIDGNDRMDIMKVVYATWVLAKDALTWPTDDNGRHSFKLDRVAPANGFTQHDAHDALGDVEATIHIARLIRDRAPDVWSESLRNRSKHDVNALLETGHVLQLIERFGAAPPRAYIGAYTGRSTQNQNAVGFMDLEMVDPVELVGLSDESIAAAVSGSPKQIRTVTVNKHPNLFSVNDIAPDASARAQDLASMTDLHDRVGQALANRFIDQEGSEHVEQRIYAGFYSHGDKRLLSQFQMASWGQRINLMNSFEDERLQWLAQRQLYNNRPDLMDDTVGSTWEARIMERWWSGDDKAPWTTLDQVDQQLAEIEEQGSMSAAAILMLKNYYAALKNLPR
ncbi:exonuclease domain-containing protein [Roseobacter litoralis]|uniref:exonuclease domain-containing protein n=1 Tax=Roseobacter litoralis TaxID=42443 RepID=UPI002490972A|nr:exonuclease domain-containing protein [Roseobacter litoralis]